MRARVPASSANLGPGFDTLALALDRYVVVDVEPASKLIVRSVGEGEGLADDSSHLAARVAIDVAGTDRLAISVRSDIPIARGLGSSAALAVAAAAAAGAEDPLSVATAMDGHPDNAAASMVGGFVAAAVVKGGVHVVRLPLDVSLAFVVIVPDVQLSTARARQALPAEVSRESAAFNLSRMALLMAGMADCRLLIPEAAEDRLHQDYRSPLFPAAPEAAGRAGGRRGARLVLVGGRSVAARHLPRSGRPQGPGRRGAGPGRGGTGRSGAAAPCRHGRAHPGPGRLGRALRRRASSLVGVMPSQPSKDLQAVPNPAPRAGLPGHV